MLMSNTDEGVPTGALQGPQAGNKTQPELANETFVGANDFVVALLSYSGDLSECASVRVRPRRLSRQLADLRGLVRRLRTARQEWEGLWKRCDRQAI